MGETSWSGGCLCGSTRYVASGEPTNLCYCHCTSCRRAFGAPAVPWGTFSAEGFAVTRGELASYRSSPDVTRGFCAHCGTSLTYRNERRKAEIDVALATLDEPDSLAPAAHIWTQDKLPWVSTTDLPQFPTVPPEDVAQPATS